MIRTASKVGGYHRIARGGGGETRDCGFEAPGSAHGMARAIDTPIRAGAHALARACLIARRIRGVTMKRDSSDVGKCVAVQTTIKI